MKKSEFWCYGKNEAFNICPICNKPIYSGAIMVEHWHAECFEKSSVIMQRWIPCSKQLPKTSYETVLVTGKMKYKTDKEYEYFVDCAFIGGLHGTPDNFDPFMFETWNDWYEGQDEYYILAWMSLPESYKEEGE